MRAGKTEKARNGPMAGRRTYARDARGRFASSGGGGRLTGGSLKARTSARRSREKLAAKNQNDTSLSASLSRRAQRAAVTRTGKAAAVATVANRRRLAGARPVGTVAKRKTRSTLNPAATATAVGSPIGGSSKRTRAGGIKGTMKPPVTLAGLQRAGGSRWQKGSMDRVYFNNVLDRTSLKVNRFKTGRISDASLRGQSISNAKAGEIATRIQASKIFYDRKTRRMVVQAPPFYSGRDAQVKKAESMTKAVARQLMRESRMPVSRRRKRSS